MDKLLQAYADFLGQANTVQQKLAFDREHDHYLIMSKWDGTEDGIAHELEAAGIPKEHIVLAF